MTPPEVVAYYERAADAMLPFLADRPLVLREPGKRRFTRQAPADTPDSVAAVGITSPDTGKTVDYLIAQDRDSLLWLVRRGHVELHGWHSRVQSLGCPDYAFFDLDPSAGSTYADACRVAQLVKREMDRRGLQAYPKTSGLTGIQVYVPSRAEHPFNQVRAWTREVCEHIHRDHPDLTTMEWQVARRTGVFLDHAMMAPNKNAVVALSLRDDAGHRVSMPLTWDEVEAAHEPSFDANTPRRRLEEARELFAPVVAGGQSLPLGEPWRDAPHVAGPDWRHAGRRLRIRCVVGGWAPPEGESAAHMGYVLLGLYYLGELAYVGKTPIDSTQRHDMYVKVAEHAAAEAPFVSVPRAFRGAHWARPDLVCAVECSGLTGGPDLRAARYLGLIAEADPRTCTLDQLER